MEITVEAELYTPSIDEKGSYIDKIPPIRYGLRCPCGSRRDKVYDTRAIFTSHIKSKCHQNWLDTLNTNRTNYYAENEVQKTLIENQRSIIQKQAIELKIKDVTINFLTTQLQERTNISENLNLLDFD